MSVINQTLDIRIMNLHVFFPPNAQINCSDWLNMNTVKVKGGKGERHISPCLIPRLPPLVKDNCFFAVISMPLKMPGTARINYGAA